MAEEYKAEAAVILEAGRELGKLISDVRNISEGDIPFLVIPDDEGGVNIKNLERLAEVPVAVRAVVTLNALASFIVYVNDFKRTPRVFADVTLTGAKLTAVLDYHESPLAARWGDHRALYPCPPSPEWTRWVGSSGKMMNQTDFARFIEDNLIDCADPSGAEMLEVAMHLEATKDVAFKSAVRLDNGARDFRYVENVEASAGKGKGFAVPSVFTIGIPPFVGSQPYKVECRLRYRIDGGTLAIGYELVRPHKVIEAASKDIITQVEAECETTVLLGVPPPQTPLL